MPRAGGIYSAPPGTTATPNTTVASAPYNAWVADVVADANAARPVTAGGIGASTAIGGNDNLNAAGASIASGSTVNLANATGVALTVTGTVTITSFGTVAAGAERVLTFAAALTLTYNATSMILPGAANIVTAAGDVATFRSLGGGNWQCTDYLRANGSPIAFGSSATLVSTDAGSAQGPTLDLFRDSASPAASDFLAQVYFNGRNSAAAKIQYSSLNGRIDDPTSGSEDGTLYAATYVNGALGARWYTGAGFYTAGASGSDKGVDSLNINALFIGGLPTSANMISGLAVTATSASQVQIVGTGGLSVTANLASSGANGLDTGAEASSTWYYVWLIWNGVTVAALLSASSTAPTMPAGYTQKLRVGAVRNDASSNLWRTLQYGRRVQIQIGTNPTTVPVITSGSSGSPTTPTWTAVAVGSFVPPTASCIRGTMLMAQSDSTRAILAPNNTYGAYNSTNAPPIGNGNNGITGSTILVNEQFDFVLESTNIYYASSNGSTNVLLNGWEDNL